MEIIDDLLEKEFDFPMKAIIYNNMEVALRAYNKLVSENHNLFKRGCFVQKLCTRRSKRGIRSVFKE